MAFGGMTVGRCTSCGGMALHKCPCCLRPVCGICITHGSRTVRNPMLEYSFRFSVGYRFYEVPPRGDVTIDEQLCPRCYADLCRIVEPNPPTTTPRSNTPSWGTFGTSKIMTLLSREMEKAVDPPPPPKEPEPPDPIMQALLAKLDEDE